MMFKMTSTNASELAAHSFSRSAHLRQGKRGESSRCHPTCTPLEYDVRQEKIMKRDIRKPDNERHCATSCHHGGVMVIRTTYVSDVKPCGQS